LIRASQTAASFLFLQIASANAGMELEAGFRLK